MPFISIRVSKNLDDTNKNELQSKIVDIMELIPGKNADNTTICISDEYSIYNKKAPVEVAFIEVRLYKESPLDSKRTFAEHLFGIVENTINIPPSNVHINFLEFENWAANGELF